MKVTRRQTSTAPCGLLAALALVATACGSTSPAPGPEPLANPQSRWK